MSREFTPYSFKTLLKMILNEYQNKKSIFGIPEKLFFNPGKKDVFTVRKFDNRLLETPIGVAAGPHTQLAQNIIAAWLCGARYIELKTVQTLDELDISKPCIDMEDEGYNCEWSQELKLEQSFDEYLKAWIIVHILRHMFKHDNGTDKFGTIFNMSVGYNLEGIKKKNVQDFLKKMNDSSKYLKAYIKEAKELYPEIEKIEIPAKISDNITLSTMHGCPPEEIEKIANFLIEEMGYHTTIKFNPTLLGKEELRDILNNKLGFKTIVPDEAFEHDPKFEDAIKIIENVNKTAKKCNKEFAIKLTNTLESVNNKPIFPENEK